MSREQLPRLAPRAQAKPRWHKAEHVDFVPRDTVDLLEQTLQIEGAPRWIGQVISGILDLDADTLGEGEGVAPLSADCRRTARLLSMLLLEQERRLEEVCTGRLIRLVLETDEAAGFCFSVVPRECIAGFVFELSPDTARTTVTQADGVLVDLVDVLRERLGLNSQDPGGLASVRAQRSKTGRDPGTAAPVRIQPLPVTAGDPSGPLYDSVRAAVSFESLQWAAHVRDGELLFSVDQFEHPELVDYFRVMGIEARRKFYGGFALEALALTNRVGRVVRSLLGGPVRRVVLDVEQGAVVIHRLGPEDHLIGLTLIQRKVAETEATLADIVAARTLA